MYACQEKNCKNGGFCLCIFGPGQNGVEAVMKN